MAAHGLYTGCRFGWDNGSLRACQWVFGSVAEQAGREREICVTRTDEFLVARLSMS
jgi:hypothetical protein